MTVTKYCDSYYCVRKNYYSRKDWIKFEVDPSVKNCPKCSAILIDESSLRQNRKVKVRKVRPSEKVYEI